MLRAHPHRNFTPKLPWKMYFGSWLCGACDALGLLNNDKVLHLKDNFTQVSSTTSGFAILKLLQRDVRFPRTKPLRKSGNDRKGVTFEESDNSTTILQYIDCGREI